MHVRTDKYGTTHLHDMPVSQVPTLSLEARITRVLSSYGVSTSAQGRLHMRACALVRQFPTLTAQQAVNIVIEAPALVPGGQVPLYA